MAALEGFPSPSLTGRLPHGGWAQEMCRDELWIHLYVRTVTVTAPLVSDYAIMRSPAAKTRHRGHQSEQSVARQFGQASAAKLA